jgi:hypothetical protein
VSASLTDRERAGLDRVVIRLGRAHAAYAEYLQGGRTVTLAEWRKRRLRFERAERAERLYTEKLLRAIRARRPMG